MEEEEGEDQGRFVRSPFSCSVNPVVSFSTTMPSGITATSAPCTSSSRQQQQSKSTMSSARTAPARSALHRRGASHDHHESNTGARPHRTVRFSHSHTPSDISIVDWKSTCHLPPPWERVDESKDWVNEDDITVFTHAVKTAGTDHAPSPLQSPNVFWKKGETQKRKRFRRFWARAPPSDVSEPRLSGPRIAGYTYLFIRFPLLVVILFIMFLELMGYVLVRQIVNLWEYFYTW